MDERWPHKGEQWTHKDGSGLVTIDAMFENDTFYTRYGHGYTCETEMFKKAYMKKDAQVLALSQLPCHKWQGIASKQA